MKQKIKEGDIFQVPLKDGKFVFGKVLESTWAFYDLCVATDENIELDIINSSKVAFKLWVTEFALTKDLWTIIGNRALTAEESETVYFYKQDRINNKVWRTLTGAEKEPITVEECLQLEVASVWDPEHVVERLECQFFNIKDLGLELKKERLIQKGISTK
jgi:hypothetical protein